MGVALHLNSYAPLSKDTLDPNLVEIDTVVLQKKMF